MPQMTAICLNNLLSVASSLTGNSSVLHHLYKALMGFNAFSNRLAGSCDLAPPLDLDLRREMVVDAARFILLRMGFTT